MVNSTKRQLTIDAAAARLRVKLFWAKEHWYRDFTLNQPKTEEFNYDICRNETGRKL